MSNIKKLGLILWKNWLFRRRHFIMTALELIFPTFFALIMLYIRQQGGTSFSVVYINETTPPKVQNVSMETFNGFDHRYDEQYILYTPPSAERFLNYLKIAIDKRVAGQVTFLNVSSEAVINSWTEKTGGDKTEMVLGLVFEGLKEDGSFDGNLKYKIRLGSRYTNWHTGELEKNDLQSGPATGDYEKNTYQSNPAFLFVQHAISLGIIESETGATNLLNNYSISTSDYPYPPYFDDKGYTTVMTIMLPLFLIMSYIFTAPIIVRRIVREKEIGVKELMKLMGIPNWIQWIGWYISSFIMMAISAAFIIFFLCIPINGLPGVLGKSDPSFLYILFLIYSSAAVSFCFVLSTIFKKPTIAAGTTILYWMSTFCVPYYGSFQNYSTLSSSVKLLLSLFPNMALAWAIKIIAAFESRGQGIQWHNLNEFATENENITMTYLILMTLFDTVLYLAITWYIDNVFPGAYGVPKPWNFLFTKVYWKKERKRERARSVDIADVDRDKFENEPTQLSPVIVIKNLFKSYGWGQSEKFAVNDLSLNVYEGQITALLGHNGAGKTTTMSILTGMFSPSKGTAYINGYDICTDIDEIRQDIGLCPQHNMLFDSLTVEEHLKFFGKLKVDSASKLSVEINEILRKLQMEDKRYTMARQLSGGMKRKLNLAISLIGGAKVVMLDEPTSGMDPEARRAIWDILQEYRTGRCILLSTHFMEEADVLGDRIAIMANGQIECCGSPMFLKKRYGAGYHLRISLEDYVDHVNIVEITKFIQRYVSSSYLGDKNNNELSYVLPSNTTKDFPSLFENLEMSSEKLKIKAFGLSVTTMEEVFLKVGETAESGEETNDKAHCSTMDLNGFEDGPDKNVGLKMKVQQSYGLMLKRFYYARHRLNFLLIGQLLIPILTILMMVLLSNALADAKNNSLPVLQLDLSHYKSCRVFETHMDSNIPNDLSKTFLSLLPKKCQPIEPKEDAITYLERMGKDEFNIYRNELLLGASLNETTENIEIRIYFNAFFYHTPPTGLNLIHNAMFKYYSGGKDLSLTVINAPFKTPDDMNNIGGGPSQNTMFTAILAIVFFSIALSILGASFIDFPVHERVTKSKNLQFMTGVGGFLFWSVSFLWDFLICFVSFIVVIILLASFDTTKIFYAENIGIIFFILLLFCWASLPFSYLVSGIFKAPATGFIIVSIVSLFISLGFGFNNLFAPSGWMVIFAFLPTYSANNAIVRTIMIGGWNNRCKLISAKVLELACNDTTFPREIRQCCDNCGNDCFQKKSYFTDDQYGSESSIIELLVMGGIYVMILFFLDSSLCHVIGHNLNQQLQRMRPRVINYTNNLDADVLAEKERITNESLGNAARSDILVVRDLSKLFGTFIAVDKLNFGVESGSCFGLLGINGAGKTTTFQQLTADLFVTSGDAFINQFSVTKNRDQYISNIGYCPQFDALLDHMTGKELLRVFANLHGIRQNQVEYVVNKTLEDFDLTQHSNKPILAYSGGNKRKLSAALAFIGQPEVVFLDEPTTGVDPIARRKIWTMIKNSNASGTAVVLTSHSMEECEVLCSRVGIMVNGQFQCLGGIQYLKNKFSQGFTILAKLKRNVGSDFQDQNNQIELQQFIAENFPSALLKDVHQGLVHYQVRDLNTKLTYLFSTMEIAKERFELEDYSVSQASLEQVFISFARMQRTDNKVQGVQEELPNFQV